MKAVLCKAHGPADQLILEQVDGPTAKAGQALLAQQPARAG